MKLCRRGSNYIFILDLTPASTDWAMSTARRDKAHLDFGICCPYIIFVAFILEVQQCASIEPRTRMNDETPYLLCGCDYLPMP